MEDSRLNTYKIAAFAFLFCMVSCLKVEIVQAPEARQLDTTIYKAPPKPPKPPKPPRDTTQKDTTRIPISFEVSVEDWGDDDNNDINL